MGSAYDPLVLRRCALAVSVLHDLDLLPDEDEGVLLTAAPPVRVSWDECRRALGEVDPESALGRRRLAGWLLARRWVADRSFDQLAERARPVGMVVGSELHPGQDWVRRRILGGALDLGPGFLGLDPSRPDHVVAPPNGVLVAAGIDPAAWWPAALDYLERMGARATERWTRDPAAPLRPMGDCDVVTLLSSATLRSALAGGTAGGMRAVAVPMRTRGWLDLSRIDPAFALAAAAATEPAERGFDRPVLVTADEVVLPVAGGRPAEIVLRDPAVGSEELRDALYR